MNRHQTTIEQQAQIVRIDPGAIPSSALQTAYQVIAQPAHAQISKWFTRDAIVDYQLAVQSQLIDCKLMVRDDPHSRRIIMTGPPGACWLQTQFLSKADGTYHVIAFYRSLDREHAEVDFAFQKLLGDEVTLMRVTELTILAGSYHKYK